MNTPNQTLKHKKQGSTDQTTFEDLNMHHPNEQKQAKKDTPDRYKAPAARKYPPKHYYAAKLERCKEKTLKVSECVIVEGYHPLERYYTTQHYEDMLLKARKHFGFNEMVIVYLAADHKNPAHIVAEHPFELNATRYL